LAEPRS